jgi:hypothetical protein
MRPIIPSLLLLLAFAACETREHGTVARALDEATDSAARSAPAAMPAAPLIDPRSPKLVADPAHRRFNHTITADLDGDGTEESLVILADAELDEELRPVWGDGHAWVAYVEEPDGARTYLYARQIQEGMLLPRLMPAAGDRTRAIVLEEETNQTLGAYELRYRGPNRVELVSREDGPKPSTEF